MGDAPRRPPTAWRPGAARLPCEAPGVRALRLHVGVDAPLAGLPVYAVLDLFVDIEHDRFWWWHGAALTASLLTVVAAVFVFLAARGFVQPVPAVLSALAFGLGSCAWPVSSQALWQHPASTFLLSLGAWLLLRSERRPLAAAWCGAALGMAVLCRPTVAVVVVCTGAYLLCVGPPPMRRLRARRAAVPGVRIRAERGSERHRAFEDRVRRPVAELLAGESARPAVQPGTGSGLVLARAGAGPGQRGGRMARPAPPSPDPVVPLQLGTVLLILVAGKWFDWWGGVTWGYRSIIDAFVERIVASRPLRVVWGVLLACSVAVQFVGAYSYSLMGWSDLWREYDRPGQASLWRWDRPQIGYHLANSLSSIGCGGDS